MKRIVVWIFMTVLSSHFSQAQLTDVEQVRTILKTSGQDWQENMNCKQVSFGNVSMGTLAEILVKNERPEITNLIRNYFSTKDPNILNTAISLYCAPQSKPVDLNAVSISLLIDTQIAIGADVLNIFNSRTHRKIFYDTMFWCQKDLESRKITVDDCLNKFSDQLSLSRDNYLRLSQLSKQSTLLYAEIRQRGEYSCNSVQRFKNMSEQDKDRYFISKVSSFSFDLAKDDRQILSIMNQCQN